MWCRNVVKRMNQNEVKNTIFHQLTKRCTSAQVDSDYSSKVDGKGLFALLPCQPGDMVFEEYPVGVTAVAYWDIRETCCANCVRPFTDNSNTVECGTADCGEKYCSNSCFEWAERLYHSNLCSGRNPHYKRYFEIASNSHNEYYIVAARLLNMFPGAPWLHHYECPEWTTLDHSSPETDLEEENAVMTDLINKFIKPNISQEVLSKTIGMLRINVLALKHGDLEIGFALYSTQSLMNHSKEPNCQCVTVSSSELPNTPCLCSVEAISDIRPGDELTISYVHVMEEPQRARVLRYQYNIVE